MFKVILDTNFYRNLSRNKTNKQLVRLLNKIKSAENKKDISPLFNPIVAKELLVHINHKNWTHRKYIIQSLKALYQHSGTRENYEAIPSPELLIGKSFFHQEIKMKIETQNAIGQMAFHISKNPCLETFLKLEKNLSLNKKHIEEGEKGFTESITNFFKQIDPNSNGSNLFKSDKNKRNTVVKQIESKKTSIEIASAMLHVTNLLLNVQNKTKILSLKELEPMAEKFIEIFPEPINLQKEVFKKVVQNNFNIEKHSNYIWDIHMMYYAGQNKINSSNMIFVTSDKAMIKSALNTNTQNIIYNYQEYLDFLDIK
ncbi:hypothetical protein [Cellulophaga sp. HaHa_2_1]|uniref:hypothetical protein n=1 Tax=Cellulophaga sp. HaHa_2_1 TaxID=2749994 RepID=UPI001C4EC563|nr:hypothetical protein [Cellulophaga sp. HaHa_2_1]QXP52512.1 hypothetical protein H0I24_00885 [Cellulophaga sp. HaHa_2_1]